MPSDIGALTIVLMISTVLVRTALMKMQGVGAMKFGATHRSDFLIPPFALFYLYTILAHAFGWPTLSSHVLFHSLIAEWIGACLCLLGLCLFAWSLVSFGRSFRVGIDADGPGRLVTNGVFALSRNPIYVAFGTVLVGQFLVFPNWILLGYTAAGMWLFNRQVLREEEFLIQHHGDRYVDYCHRVRRYI